MWVLFGVFPMLSNFYQSNLPNRFLLMHHQQKKKQASFYWIVSVESACAYCLLMT
jgi:hypothetical protein